MRVLGVGGTVELPSPRQRSAPRPHPALCCFFRQEGRQPAGEQMSHWLSPSYLRWDSWILGRVSWLGAGSSSKSPSSAPSHPSPVSPPLPQALQCPGLASFQRRHTAPGGGGGPRDFQGTPTLSRFGGSEPKLGPDWLQVAQPGGAEDEPRPGSFPRAVTQPLQGTSGGLQLTLWDLEAQADLIRAWSKPQEHSTL